MAGCSYRGGAAQNHCRLRRVRASFADLIIAFLDDHFENHFRNPMPTFSVAVAPSHSSPADYMMEALRFDRKAVVPGKPELAEQSLTNLCIRTRRRPVGRNRIWQ